MTIEAEDITLDKFLKRFTYQGDPTPDGKIVLPLDVFFNACAILKLANTIDGLRHK